MNKGRWNDSCTYIFGIRVRIIRRAMRKTVFSGLLRSERSRISTFSSAKGVPSRRPCVARRPAGPPPFFAVVFSTLRGHALPISDSN